MFTTEELQLIHAICQRVDPTGMMAPVQALRFKIEQHFQAAQAVATGIADQPVDGAPGKKEAEVKP